MWSHPTKLLKSMNKNSCNLFLSRGNIYLVFKMFFINILQDIRKDRCAFPRFPFPERLLFFHWCTKASLRTEDLFGFAPSWLLFFTPKVNSFSKKHTHGRTANASLENNGKNVHVYQILWSLKPGMSNWRPHCSFNAARSYFLWSL